MEKRFGALSSSEDPSKLAATITGLIKVVSGVLVTFGFVTVADTSTLIGQIEIIVPAGYALYGSAEAIFGILRKILIGLHGKLSS